MPAYTYRCMCPYPSDETTQRRAIEDRDTTRYCPRCCAEFHRVPDAPAIHFRGSGFYVTDYKGKS